MKVGNNLESKQVDLVTRVTNGPRGASPSPQETGTPAPVDKVELSSTSRNISASERAEQPLRASKVDEVKAAIQEGRFHVSAEVVADKMISQAAELIETMASGRGQ